MVEEEKPTEEAKPEDKQPMSVLEETKLAIAELKKEKEEISQVKEEISKMRSEQLLSGSAGGAVKEEKKEETPAEYKDRVMKGEV